MRMLAIISLLMPFCTLCCAQTDSVYSHKGKSMIRYFDIDDFVAKAKGSDFYECMEGHTKVTCFKINDTNGVHVGYTENRESLDTPYSNYYEYDLKGRLRYSLESFYNISIRKKCHYDTLGRVVQMEDKDKPYKFTLESLIKKMKAEYGYDILDRKMTLKMYRSEGKNDLHKPWYEVWCNEDSSGSYSDHFLIDGTTGETLYMEKHVDNLMLMTPEEELKATTNKFPIKLQDKYLYEQSKKNQQDKKGTKKKGKSFWRKLFD